MTEKKECNRCGCGLKRIDYLEPDWEGCYEHSAQRRPPLCQSCWIKADSEACQRAAQRKRKHD